jgi:opacity protein-like surface antigen
MKRIPIIEGAWVRAALGLVLAAAILASVAQAQAQRVDRGPWTVGASAGAWAPLSSLIRAADSFDTRLSAGPVFSLEARYLAADPVTLYASALLAFSTIRLGSSIRPDVVGPSDQCVVGGGTAGVVLGPTDRPGEHIRPTLRLGGGVKWYRFDLTGVDSQLRPAGDLGVGLAGAGAGPIEVSAEVRYLPGSFDQSRLPTRGIETQNQRQTDLMFTIGFAIRP